jgi:hypothetical protein
MEIHPQRARRRGKGWHSRANADFPEQVLDFKQDFPAHFVIDLSLCSTGAGRRRA